jgi:hypothetical protein
MVKTDEKDYLTGSGFWGTNPLMRIPKDSEWGCLGEIRTLFS